VRWLFRKFRPVAVPPADKLLDSCKLATLNPTPNRTKNPKSPKTPGLTSPPPTTSPQNRNSRTATLNRCQNGKFAVPFSFEEEEERESLRKTWTVIEGTERWMLRSPRFIGTTCEIRLQTTARSSIARILAQFSYQQKDRVFKQQPSGDRSCSSHHDFKYKFAPLAAPVW
jgi:hypothetical protein